MGVGEDYTQLIADLKGKFQEKQFLEPVVARERSNQKESRTDYNNETSNKEKEKELESGADYTGESADYHFGDYSDNTSDSSNKTVANPINFSEKKFTSNLTKKNAVSTISQLDHLNGTHNLGKKNSTDGDHQVESGKDYNESEDYHFDDTSDSKGKILEEK